MTDERRVCVRCAARLRRDQRGALCDPCDRRGLVPGEVLSPEFFAKERIRVALLSCDFATFFRAVRTYARLSQRELGDLLGLDQPRISGIERGKHRLRDVLTVVRVANVLGIPPVMLGFGAGAVTVGGNAIAGREVSWVERRDFIQHVAAVTLGLSVAGVDVDRLTVLLDSSAEPAGSRRIGATDVHAIEQATAAFRRHDFAHGGGLSAAAVIAQLRSVLPLLDAQVSPEVRSRLLVATADLALLAGWISYDVEQHEVARRLWLIALDLARDADQPCGADLTVDLLSRMAHQSLHLHRPGEAQRLIGLGYATTASGSHPASASTITGLAANLAWAHAAQGDAAACERALGQVEEQYSVADPAVAAPWTGHLNEAGFAAHQGYAYYTLASVKRAPRAADKAIPLLRHAVDRFGSDYARARALYLADLAGAHALAGDTDVAVSVGHQAVDSITALSSPRAYQRLRNFDTVLRPLTTCGVADLRSRLAATAA